MKKIGKYTIEYRLGRGGMAEVWLGNHPTLDRQVAIKVLHRFLGEEAGFSQRFSQEARLVASLRHPNIVQLYDFDIDDDRPYMVMEYVKGGTLHDRLKLKTVPKLSLSEIAHLVGQIATGLAYAHQQGAIHRDLKPANILLTGHHQPIISDFGIAKLLHRDGNISGINATIGTPNYMSPEQALGEAVDGRSDIYALGVMLFELMTGRLPFLADNPAVLLSQHISQIPPSPRRLNPEISIEVEQVILQALAKEPAGRYADANSMAVALFEAMGETMPGYETGLHPPAFLANHKEIRVDRSRIYWLQALILAQHEGWAADSVTAALKKAEAELDRSPDPSFDLKILPAKWLNAIFRQQLSAAQKIAQNFLQRSQEADRLKIRPVGHLILGLTLLEKGRYLPAKANFLRGLGLFTADASVELLLHRYRWLDTGLLLRMALSYTCFHLNEMGESRYYRQQSVSYAQQISLST